MDAARKSDNLPVLRITASPRSGTKKSDSSRGPSKSRGQRRHSTATTGNTSAHPTPELPKGSKRTGRADPAAAAKLLASKTDGLRNLTGAKIVEVLEDLTQQYGLPTTMRRAKNAKRYLEGVERFYDRYTEQHPVLGAAAQLFITPWIQAAKAFNVDTVEMVRAASSLNPLAKAYIDFNPVLRAADQVPNRFPTVYAPSFLTDGEKNTDTVLTLLADSLLAHLRAKPDDPSAKKMARSIWKAMSKPLRRPEQDGDRTRRWFIMWGMQRRLAPKDAKAHNDWHDRITYGKNADVVEHIAHHWHDAADLSYENRPVDAYYALFTGDPSDPYNH